MHFSKLGTGQTTHKYLLTYLSWLVNWLLTHDVNICALRLNIHCTLVYQTLLVPYVCTVWLFKPSRVNLISFFECELFSRVPRNTKVLLGTLINICSKLQKVPFQWGLKSAFHISNEKVTFWLGLKKCLAKIRIENVPFRLW